MAEFVATREARRGVWGIDPRGRGRDGQVTDEALGVLGVRRGEALANAFCHRDYSSGGGSVGVAIYDDRLEITSFGTLHFGLTPAAQFEQHESLPWNPLLARVMYRRGLIES